MSLCQVPHTSLAPMLLLSYIWTSCSMLSWRISDSKYAILSCYTSLTSYTARAAPVFSVYNISSPWSSTTFSVSLQLAVPRTLMSRRDLHLLGDCCWSTPVCSELLQMVEIDWYMWVPVPDCSGYFCGGIAKISPGLFPFCASCCPRTSICPTVSSNRGGANSSHSQ